MFTCGPISYFIWDEHLLKPQIQKIINEQGEKDMYFHPFAFIACLDYV